MIKQRKKIKVHIRSQTIDLFDISFPPGSSLEQLFEPMFDDDEHLPPFPPTGENENDILEYSSIGMVSDDGKTLKVSYEEGGLEGLEGCIASINSTMMNPGWLP